MKIAIFVGAFVYLMQYVYGRIIIFGSIIYMIL